MYPSKIFHPTIISDNGLPIARLTPHSNIRVSISHKTPTNIKSRVGTPQHIKEVNKQKQSMRVIIPI